MDNVLDVTHWPLVAQQMESESKRRIGVGFTGLGNALAMLDINYDTEQANDVASQIAMTMRDAAYKASVELAKEKGAFPLLDVDKYLEEGTCASRLPEAIKDDIRKYGIRNSHLLSIAPVGTVSLAFCDNASNGIEPPFSLTYKRRKRINDGEFQEYFVVDHGLRVFLGTLEDKAFAQALFDAVCNNERIFKYDERTFDSRYCLPASLITAQVLSVEGHLKMMQAVQPYCDSSLSKCVVKGTRILTNQGILKVEDLGYATLPDTFAESRKDLKVLCPDGNWRKVTKHYYGGSKSIVKIVLKNGQVISGSQVHKLQCPAGWTQMSELKIGDKIKIRRNIKLDNPGGKELDKAFFHPISKKYTIPTHMSPELALFLGMFCADGHLHEEGGFVGLHKKDLNVGKIFSDLAKTLFSVDLKHTVDPRTNVDCWHFNSRTVCRWIRNIIGYRSYDKHVPETILQGSPDEMKAFLRGITLDGYKVTNNGRESTVLYCGRSESLARDSFSLLVALGYSPRLQNKNVIGYNYKVWGVSSINIDFCIQEHKNSEYSECNEYVKIPDNLIGSYFPSVSTSYYCIRSWKDRQSEVCKEIQLRNTFPEFQTDTNFIYSEITKIFFGFDEVYDIEVEESHDYLIDGVVSHNTVNIPADYPFEDFKKVYDIAHSYKLKGVATYRPNATLGSILSITSEPKKEETIAMTQTNNIQIDEDDEEYALPKDVLNEVVLKRPENELDSVTKKVRYSSFNGDESFYVSVSFMEVSQTVEGKVYKGLRPIEVFLTAYPDGVPGEWIAVYGRNLSLLARAGLNTFCKSLEDSRKIKSDKGRVRYGWYTKQDGSKVPRFHESDVACIAFAIQEILINKGVLDKDNKVIDVCLQNKKQDRTQIHISLDESELQDKLEKIITGLNVTRTEVTATYDDLVKNQSNLTPGKVCKECGAAAVIKKDSCDYCTNCGAVGSCG